MTPSQLEHLKHIDAYCEHKLTAAEYIPHYSEGAEAGWMAARAAIAHILSGGHGHDNGEDILAKSILAAFPLELIQKP